MSDKFTNLRRYNLWEGETPDVGYIRSIYVDRVYDMTGNRLIKVLVGQRRVGKSYILRQVAMKLIEGGVEWKNIFMLNMDISEFSCVKAESDLSELFDDYMKEIKPHGKVYIFIDEIQNIQGWERFVNSYSQDYMRDYELFITGSNSNMLSSELATLLSGRYVCLEVLPFSYTEYVDYKKVDMNHASFVDYMHSSGMPETFYLRNDESKRFYISSLKDTILLRDVVARNNVRDVSALEDVFMYVMNNMSNFLSVNNVVNYMKSQGRRLSYETVSSYLRFFEQAYLVFRADRYDLKGKAIMSNVVKYYANDLSFRNYLYRGFSYGEGYLLENVVYLMLRGSGYNVYVGNVEKKEVDFVAIKDDRRIYVQVSNSIADDETARREYSSLELIKDSYEKYIVTLDDFKHPSNNGIRHIRAWEFMQIIN